MIPDGMANDSFRNFDHRMFFNTVLNNNCDKQMPTTGYNVKIQTWSRRGKDL